MTYIEHEEFLTAKDFVMSGQEVDDKKLIEINNHPLGIENNLPIKETFEYDEDIIGRTATGILVYRSDDPGEEQGHKEKSTRQIKKEESIKEEMDLREKQFMRYREIRDEMKERGDKRHIFLIPRGILVENYRKNGQYKREEFFKGNLSQDVLAVKEDDYVRLVPLIPDNEIKINYYSARFGERFRDPIKDTRYRTKDEVFKKFDLTNQGINSGQQLYDLLKKPKK